MNATAVQERKTAKLKTPSELGSNAIKDISAALRALLADTFALYLKTKNFHWHMSGPHFRDYHLLLDEQSEQIFAMTAQDRRHHAALGRQYRPAAAPARQRCGVRHRGGHAG